MSTDTQLPTYDDVVRASERIGPYVRRTPIMTSRGLDEYCGRQVYVKAEHLQLTGAYKVRGGTNFLLTHLDRGLVPGGGVVAASSGNHGLGVAWAARRARVKATIVLPADVVRIKHDAIADFGARIVLAEPDQSVACAEHIAKTEGLLNIPPYDHPAIIAGQGTCALEALAEVPPVDAIVVPVGGGALAAGTVLVAGQAKRPVSVVGVEPSGADDTRRSLSAGTRVAVTQPHSVADGLLPARPGRLTFAINRAGLTEVACVPDVAILRAMRFVAARMKQVIEPSAAVTVAALATGQIAGSGAVLVLFSGGNVNLSTFSAQPA